MAAGYDADNRETLFACGLKNIDEASPTRLKRSFSKTPCRTWSAKGMDCDLIDAAIHQIEFHRKEITNTPYPFGIKILLRIIGTWLHGGQPEKVLKFDA